MTTLRENPRISVNKLSEYITALPNRRRTIVKQQKRPPSVIVPYYKEAEKIILDYLVSFNGNEEWLNTKTQELLDKTVTSDWEETRRDICIDAVDSFAEFVSDLNFSGLRCVAGDPNPEKLNIEGVQVSIRPEIYLQDNDGNVNGCVKLVFGKGRELSEDEAKYTGTCLQRWMIEFFNISEHKLCFVVDIFGRKYHIAPKAYKKRLSDIEAACQEISRAWDNA